MTTQIARGVISVCLAFVPVPRFPETHVCAAVINSDATIADATYATEGLRIEAGSTPPTVVTVLAGAMIGTTPPQDTGVYDDSIVNMSGGTIGDDLWAYDTSTANVSDGSFDDIFVEDYATLNFSGGTTADDIRMFSHSTLNLTGGVIGNDLFGFGNSHLKIWDATIQDDLVTTDSTVIDVYGGAIYDDVYAQVSGVINVYGGSFQGVLRFSGPDAIIRVFGYNLSFSGDFLTGTLADGTALNNPVWLYSGATSGQLELVQIPEPSSLVLWFLLAALGMTLHRQRWRRSSSGR